MARAVNGQRDERGQADELLWHADTRCGGVQSAGSMCIYDRMTIMTIYR